MTPSQAEQELTSSAARRFVSALSAVESDGDLDAMAAAGTDSTTWWGVGGHRQETGPEGARRFWSGYRRAFAEIRTTFTAVTETDSRAVLEWVSTGRHHNGQPVRYGGVTVLDLDQDADRSVEAVRLYFDTAAASSTAASVTGGSGARSGESDVDKVDNIDGILDRETSAAAHNSGMVRD